jgi:hypothetical protein
MTPQNMSAIDGAYPPNTVAKSERSASVQTRSPSVRNEIAMRFLRNPPVEFAARLVGLRKLANLKWLFTFWKRKLPQQAGRARGILSPSQCEVSSDRCYRVSRRLASLIALRMPSALAFPVPAMS